MGEVCEECGAAGDDFNPVVLTINGFLCIECIDSTDEDDGEYT